MADAIDPVERIEALLDTAEPRIARAFVAAINGLRGELDLAEVERLLLAGDFEGALRLTQTVAEQLGQASTVTFFSAGQDTATFLSGLDLGTIVFDQVNTRAVQAMQANNLRLISEYTSEQRAATRLALLDGIARGLNPRDQARNFRDSVGLTERQQAAVINYRRLLEGSAADQREAATRALATKTDQKSAKAAARLGKPFKPEHIDRMVERYRARYVKYRAEVIARTEALRSVHQGVEEGYQQAIDAGKLDAQDLIRTWDSSKDARVRTTHKALNGQRRGWGGTWQTVNGVLRFPGDPNAVAEETVQCRCVLTTRIKGALKTIRKYRLFKRANDDEVWGMAA